jgi:hypothetical protein
MQMRLFKSNLLFVSIFLFLSFNTHALFSDGLKDHKSIWQNIGDDIVISLNDAGAYYTAPLHYTGTDWLHTAGIAGITVLFMTTDKEAKKQLGRNTITSINHDLWDVPYYYGDAVYAGAFCGTVYAAGLFTRSDGVRVTGRLMLESLAFAGSVNLLLKFAAGRQRPYAAANQWNYKPFNVKNEFNSFPSGHATVAFALSSVLAQRIGNVWASIGLYGFAGLTAVSRVVNNQHWVSDVFFGSVLGLGAGYFVVHMENEREHRPGHGAYGFSIYPSLNGLNVVWKF